MEKQLNEKITAYFKTFKDKLVEQLKETNIQDNNMSDTLNFIYSYPHMSFKKEDFQKAHSLFLKLLL